MIATTERNLTTGEAATTRRRLEESTSPLWQFTRPQPAIWMHHVHVDKSESKSRLRLRDVLRLLRHSDELPLLAEKLMSSPGAGRAVRTSPAAMAAEWTTRLKTLKSVFSQIERCAEAVELKDGTGGYWLDDRKNNNNFSSALDSGDEAENERGELHETLWRVDASLTAIGMKPLLASDDSRRLRDEDEGSCGAPPTGSSCVRIADPCNIASSFYTTRREAMASHSYTPQSSLVIVAFDKANGSQSKVFNAVDAGEIARFLHEIPHSKDRNGYVLVDEARPVDPFFDLDVDVSYVLAAFPELAKKGQVDEACELFLLDVLKFLQFAVCQFFNCAISETLVLSSTVLHRSSNGGDQTADQLEQVWTGKVSFHLHFRVDDRRCFANISTHKQFVETLEDSTIPWRASSSVSSTSGVGGGLELPEDLARKALVLRAIDASVYTKWRPLRLPWCTKRQETEDLQLLAVPAANSRRIEVNDEAHSSSGAVFGAPAVAPITVRSGQTIYRDKRRFLQPIILGVTTIKSESLSQLLQQCKCLSLLPPAVVAASRPVQKLLDFAVVNVMRLSLIQRFESEHVVPHGDESFGDRLPQAAQTTLVPFGCGTRRYVHGVLQAALAEVFRCVHHKYREVDATTISTMSITAQFEDNGTSRGYYVYQKKNRFCVALQREHKSTFGQLYVTYGSIKYRCYSNDCCRKCIKIPWSAATTATEEGAINTTTGDPLQFKGWSDGSVPNFTRLLELREQLFPQLDEDELSRRYGLLKSLSSVSGGASVEVAADTS